MCNGILLKVKPYRPFNSTLG